MKRTFGVGPVLVQLELASRKEPYFWLSSDKGYRHAFLLSVGTVTSLDDVRCWQLMLGPLSVTVTTVKEMLE